MFGIKAEAFGWLMDDIGFQEYLSGNTDIDPRIKFHTEQDALKFVDRFAERKACYKVEEFEEGTSY